MYKAFKPKKLAAHIYYKFIEFGQVRGPAGLCRVDGRNHALLGGCTLQHGPLAQPPMPSPNTSRFWLASAAGYQSVGETPHSTSCKLWQIIII